MPYYKKYINPIFFRMAEDLESIYKYQTLAQAMDTLLVFCLTLYLVSSVIILFLSTTIAFILRVFMIPKFSPKNCKFDLDRGGVENFNMIVRKFYFQTLSASVVTNIAFSHVISVRRLFVASL